MQLRRLAILAAVLATASVARDADVARAIPFMAGADISALPVYQGKSAIYRDGGIATPVIDMFRDHDVNWFRLRLFVNPSTASDAFTGNDIPYTIALAQRIKAAGGKLLLDFHYSDTWADPGHQTKPAAWSSLSFADLTTRVHDYTRDTIAAFTAAGVGPQMVQVGNEISNGLLWSSGYPWTGGNNNTGLNNLATLLKAGINGVKDGADPAYQPLIMIHHDRGDDWATAKYYYDALTARNVPFDVIGYSYYPKFHYDPATQNGNIADLRTTLNNSAATYNKPVVVVETGFASRTAAGEPTYEFPISPAGQRQFLDAVVDAVRDVPNNKGYGVFWWYPEAKPTSGLSVWEGGRYGWFDANGNLLSTIDAFAGINVPGDYNRDGLVNAADLAVLSATFGQTGANLDADSNNDGRIDGADFLYWQQHAAAATGQPPSNAAPEPASALVALAGIGILAASKRQRRHSELRFIERRLWSRTLRPFT